jgi:UDP-N-acetylglucosamine 1-carboxyvinyltransferase
MLDDASNQSDAHLVQVGRLIQDARRHRGMTQSALAELLDTSPADVDRIEHGGQALPTDMLARINDAFGSDLPSPGDSRPVHLRVAGDTKLSGSIDVKSSKNAGVALLCASLLNKGTTTLRRVARIDEVNRIIEVLESIGVRCRWLNGDNDLEIAPPLRLDLAGMDIDAARRTRSMIMLLGPLLQSEDHFELPYVGGCQLGSRTIEPHLQVLRPFGMIVKISQGCYEVEVDHTVVPTRPIVLTERGDTVTENALMAAARHPGITVIRNASPNYMVQDLCFYLVQLGVRIDGIGTTSLTVYGLSEIDADVDYAPSEDPVEAMSLLAAAIVTSSEMTICRAPIEFLEVELAILEEMGLNYDRSDEYFAVNGRTRLVDLSVRPSDLKAAIDKIHPMPFPGLNIDHLPFFAVIAATASGSTLVHDWVYENRAIYLTELIKLGANVRLLDPHRVYVEGPTRWSGAEIICPPALRPAVVVLLAMLAAEGPSVLRNVNVINRGHEQLAERLNLLGAQIETFHDPAAGFGHLLADPSPREDQT